eukprot:1160653-Pelagomonas_calceolata.AAC.17
MTDPQADVSTGSRACRSKLPLPQSCRTKSSPCCCPQPQTSHDDCANRATRSLISTPLDKQHSSPPLSWTEVLDLNSSVFVWHCHSLCLKVCARHEHKHGDHAPSFGRARCVCPGLAHFQRHQLGYQKVLQGRELGHQTAQFQRLGQGYRRGKLRDSHMQHTGHARANCLALSCDVEECVCSRLQEEESVHAAKRNPHWPGAHAWLASAYPTDGQSEEGICDMESERQHM